MFTLGLICDHCGRDATPCVITRKVLNEDIIREASDYVGVMRKVGWEYNQINDAWVCPGCIAKSERSRRLETLLEETGEEIVEGIVALAKRLNKNKKVDK